ncbi:MAG TPA: c-type cytochrome [Burkholderiales bacterium]
MKLRATALAAAAAVLGLGSAQGAVDTGAAEALMRKSGCMKCHSVSARKDGPSYKSVAEKYRGKGDAQAALHKHLTTQPTVKIDGNEEKHPSLKTASEAEIRNVVEYILSR